MEETPDKNVVAVKMCRGKAISTIMSRHSGFVLRFICLFSSRKCISTGGEFVGRDGANEEIGTS